MEFRISTCVMQSTTPHSQSRLWSFSTEAWDGVFAPLSDPTYFARVELDEGLGTIVWPNGADVAPRDPSSVGRWARCPGSGLAPTPPQALLEVERYREMIEGWEDSEQRRKTISPGKGHARSDRPRHRGPLPLSQEAAFIDADAPSAGHAIERAPDQGLSVVLVSADGSTHILKPELFTH
jgi:hypothetical protein